MWYIIYNGQQVGPMSKEALRQYDLKPDSMVWRQGMPDWTRASNVAELSDVLAGGNGQPKYGMNNSGPQAAPAYGQPYGNAGCGYGYGPQRGGYDQYGRYIPQTDKSKVAAGILALLLGWLGVQYFYLGKAGGGFITILLVIVTCGAWEIITFIQGIMMLCMSDEEFERKFVLSDKTFPLF